MRVVPHCTVGCLPLEAPALNCLGNALCSRVARQAHSEAYVRLQRGYFARSPHPHAIKCVPPLLANVRQRGHRRKYPRIFLSSVGSKGQIRLLTPTSYLRYRSQDASEMPHSQPGWGRGRCGNQHWRSLVSPVHQCEL